MKTRHIFAIMAVGALAGGLTGCNSEEELTAKPAKLKKNVEFKAEARRLLQQAEVEAFAPLREKLQRVVNKIGSERGYAFILNTDGDACPYVNSEMGEDVSQLIKEALR